MADVLVVVADNALAKIFRLENGELQLIELLQHPEGRMHERDMESDSRGRRNTGERGTDWGRSTAPDRRPKDHERAVFVHEIADYLDRMRLSNACDACHLVAAPTLLGQLRGELPKGIRPLSSIPKDLTKASRSAIVDQLGVSGTKGDRGHARPAPPSRSPAIRRRRGRAPELWRHSRPPASSAPDY